MKKNPGWGKRLVFALRKHKRAKKNPLEEDSQKGRKRKVKKKERESKEKGATKPRLEKEGTSRVLPD